jgi:hypothetical protein
LPFITGVSKKTESNFSGFAWLTVVFDLSFELWLEQL